MKTQFSFTRFWWLFRKHTAENIKYYLLCAAVLIGLLVLFMGFLIMVETSPMTTDKQGVIYVFMLLAAGPIFTSTIFAHLGDKRKAIASLTLPASHFEKYLVGWIYSYVIFQVVYIACFFLVASILLPLDDWRGQEYEIMSLYSNEDGQITGLNLFFFLHSVTFLGSIFFEKWQFIKTAFIIIIIGLVVTLVNKTILQSLLGHTLDDAFPFSNLYFSEAGEYFQLRFPEKQEYILGLVLLGTSLLLWTSAYFRLREKEV
ncbi:hypothetical protein [Rufibacter hautae]|uniref:Uncharacterized protein n=1 Tax=Rufibacter hautae TaxID=2595005 RepID=A0A5B6TBF1_9BACT|nr:hypothetical protein [Rufibacter hautae]KAA3437807.1 hypothetical protein FOA19_10970 [Rufibacter hautae]